MPPLTEKIIYGAFIDHVSLVVHPERCVVVCRYCVDYVEQFIDGRGQLDASAATFSRRIDHITDYSHAANVMQTYLTGVSCATCVEGLDTCHFMSEGPDS